MKYIISWSERSHGSAAEYEFVQKRILDVFGQWKAPSNLKFEIFVIRVGEWGGHMLVECDDVTEIHKLTTIMAPFKFEVYPVMPIDVAIKAELEAMAWRDGLKKK